MKKGIKILLIVLAVIAALAVIIWILYTWKRGKDINDMKSQFSQMLQNKGLDKQTADKAASCYIDKMVDAFGYLRAKEIFNGEEQPDAEESAKIVQFAVACGANFSRGRRAVLKNAPPRIF